MRKILVVDDSHTMRRMIMTCLKPLQPVTFLEASSGLEALERLSLTLPDVVLLDLNMPDMHGVDILRFLKESERLASIPVVVVTTRGDQASRDLVFQLGVKSYITKPFEPAELLHQVRLALETV